MNSDGEALTTQDRPLGRHTLLVNLILAVACGLSARVVQDVFGMINERIILFWPPVGLGLGMALIGGVRFLPGVFVGIAINGLWFGLRPAVAILIAMGDVLEIVLAHQILTRGIRFDRTLVHGRDYLQLLGVGLLAAATGAWVGVGGALMAGRIPTEAVVRVWTRWAMGDLLGILLMAPAVLGWWYRPTPWVKAGRGVEFTAFLALAFLAGQALFVGWTPAALAPFSKGYFAFLYVVWGAIRYGHRGVTLVLLMVLAQALTGAVHGVGYFALDARQTHLTNFWLYMVSLTAVGVTVASVSRQWEWAEGQAREEAAFTHQILESLPGGVVVFGTDRRVQFANAHAKVLLGFDAIEGLVPTAQQPVWQLVREDGSVLDVAEYPVNRVFATGEPVGNQILGVLRPGAVQPAWVLINAFPECREDGSLGKVVVMYLDISERRVEEQERRRLEGLLQQSQKMESLGTLAGGIAHDMNNVLGGIMMIGSTLQERLEDQPELVRPLETLLAASERGRDLVRKLLDFSRKDLRQARPLDLNEVVAKEMDILRHTTRQRVQIDAHLAPHLPLIQGDASALAAAIMNLSVNALDAMEGGGNLMFTTRVREDGWVVLRVADTGTGMSPEVLARAFDPFFTTKSVGKGTGLGLAMLHTTMKAHGGTVEVESFPGLGTSFILSFPPLPADVILAAMPKDPPSGGVPARRGARLALLVDDDALIREATPGLLASLGFETEALSHGEACLARLGVGRRPAFILLDHNMPGLTGMETLRRLRARGHALPVILASGYLDEEQEQELRATPNVWVLRKPYGLPELRHLLAELAPSLKASVG